MSTNSRLIFYKKNIKELEIGCAIKCRALDFPCERNRNDKTINQIPWLAIFFFILGKVSMGGGGGERSQANTDRCYHDDDAPEST